MSRSGRRSAIGRSRFGAPGPRGSPSRRGACYIVEFAKSAEHVSPEWPAGYWPQQDTPPEAAAWDTSVAQVERDLRTMERLVADPKTDLFARIPHGTGQTVLREALVLADHNAYHLGQLVLLRRLLGAWKKD